MSDIILQRLKSEDAAERREVAEELMTQEIDESLVIELTKLLEDVDKGVRDAVCFTLAYNGNPDITKFVVPYISSSDISVRNLAGDIILKIGVPAIPKCVDYIDKGNDDDQKFLIDLIGLIGTDEGIPKIREILHKSKNDNVILTHHACWRIGVCAKSLR